MSPWPPRRLPPESTPDWSAPLGVWLGAPVRIHVTLVIVLVLGVGWAVQADTLLVGLALAVYFASLLLHEAAHTVAASRVGGGVDQVVLGPVGGLRDPIMPGDPESRVFVSMTGPLSHLAMVVLGSCYLAMQSDPSLPALFFLTPFDASFQTLSTADQPLIHLARMAVCVNWPLFLLNLLPAYPFDGGAALKAWLTKWLGEDLAAIATFRLASLLGLSLVCVSFLNHEVIASGAIPTHALLASLGVMILFSARRDSLVTSDETKHSFDLASHLAGSHLNNHSSGGWYGGYEDQMVLVETRNSSLEQESPEAETVCDERVVDEVLAKLHAEGLERLTDQERSLLERASEHYRRRRDA